MSVFCEAAERHNTIKKLTIMKRETLFKAWVPSANRMTDACTIFELCEIASKRKYGLQEELILLEFTGLKDKNGKKIFEGDILLSWYSRDTSGKDIIVMTTTVEHQMDHKSSGFEIPFLHTAKIIGNIYENPDLLDTEEAKSSELIAE